MALVGVLVFTLAVLGDGWSHLVWFGQKSRPWPLVPAMVAVLASLAALAWGWHAPVTPGERAISRRLAITFAGGTWLAVVLFAAPYREFGLQLAASLSASLWALLATALRRGAVRLPRPVLVVERVFVRLVLVLACTELVLAGIATKWPNAALAGGSAEAPALVEANRAPAGSFSFGFPCDARGHYDAPPTPQPRAGKLVVSIGDSFSASVVPHYFHYTTVAERELARLRGPDSPPVEVYNMGLPGLGPPEYLHLLVSEALALEPDLIVVNFFAGNDVDPYGLVKPGPLRRWFDIHELYLVRVPLRIERLLAERRAWKREGHAGRAPWHRGDQRPLATLPEIIAAYPYVINPLLEDSNQASDSFARTEAYRSYGGCRPEERFAQFFPWVEEMVRVAHPIPIVFTLIPDDYQMDDEVWALAQDYVARAPDLGHPERLVRYHIQEVLVPEFKQRGWPLLDYLPILKAVEPLADGRLHVYHYRDTHWNARGNHVAGKALAGFLLPQLEMR